MISNGVGRWLLLRAIRGYQRWLSGRGPLRQVRCTFEHSESCSAFGSRVAGEAASTGAALKLIRDRLKRCGSLRLHFDQQLIWGEDYDRSHHTEIAHWAAEQAELPMTQAMLERAALAVARERCWSSGGLLRRALGTPGVLLRGGDGARAQRMKRVLLLKLWLPPLLVLGLLCAWSAWLVPCLIVATALAGAQLWSAQRSLHAWRERVATLRAAREFEVF